MTYVRTLCAGIFVRTPQVVLMFFDSQMRFFQAATNSEETRLRRLLCCRASAETCLQQKRETLSDCPFQRTEALSQNRFHPVSLDANKTSIYILYYIQICIYIYIYLYIVVGSKTHIVSSHQKAAMQTGKLSFLVKLR